MTNTKSATKVPAVMVGKGVGDALGAAWEFKSPDDTRLRRWKGGFVGGGWGLKAGQWTDDTHMALRLAETLLSGFTPVHMMEAYVAWVRTGDLRGIGMTCSASIHRYQREGNIETCGAAGEMAAGNGTAMRAAPIGLFARSLPELVQLCIQDADVTHRNLEAEAGSIAVAYGVHLLARIETPSPAVVRAAVQKVVNLLGLLGTEFARSKVRARIAQALRLAEDPRPQHAQALKIIGTSGYVVETVGAAFYCLLTTTSFRDAVVTAVKGGRDADTTGAVTGALAGALYGVEGIPAEYRKKVEAHQRLVSLDVQLYRRATAQA